MPRYDQMRSIMDPDYKKVSPLESEIRGGAQGLTMGYADELGGALGAAKDIASGDQSGLIEAYKRNRESSRQAYENAEQDNPAFYKAGEIGGTGASFLIPGIGTAKGIKSAAMIGAATGLGRSGADLTEGNLGQAAIDAGKGAAIGATGGMALEKLAPRFAGLMEKIGGSKPQIPSAGAAASEGAVPLSKYVTKEDFRKMINPDIAELQMSGKVTPKLAEKAAVLDKQLKEAARLEKVKRNAEDMGMSVDDYLKSTISPDEATKTITDLVRKKQAG